MSKPLQTVSIRLTPWQTRQLRALFREAAQASSAGAKGIIAAQIYAPGDYVHDVGYMRRGKQPLKVAVARVGWLRHELAVTVQRQTSVGKTDG